MQCDGEVTFFRFTILFCSHTLALMSNGNKRSHNATFKWLLWLCDASIVSRLNTTFSRCKRLIYGVVEFRCKCEYESHGHVSSAPESNVSLMFDYNFDTEFVFFLDLALAKSVCLSENKHNLIYRIRDVIDFDFIYNVHSLLLPSQWVSCVLMERKSLRVPKRKKKLREEKHGKKSGVYPNGVIISVLLNT